jgi:hypothetical protein
VPSRPVPFTDIKHTVELWHEALDEGHPAQGTRGRIGALAVAHEWLQLSGSTDTTERRLDTAVALGIPVREWHPIRPEWAAEQILRYRRHDEDFAAAERSFTNTKRPAAAPSPRRRPRSEEREQSTHPLPHRRLPSDRVLSPVEPIEDQPQNPIDLVEKVVPLLRRNPMPLPLIADRLQVDNSTAVLILELAKARGISLHLRGDLWHLDAPAMGTQGDSVAHQLVSDHDGLIRFASVGDTHLGSKYYRDDCLNDFYDNVAHRGFKTVLHAGNWIDGEAPFNRHDLLVHGMDQQMQFLAKNYPQRPGVETWAITGEDHEGWYSRREGIDVGRYAENVMRQNGREDWRDVGFMENFIDLVHAGSGQSTKLLLMHPGGGSAYAVSYAPQKIVEGFDGGDKPAVLILGHYHKASYNLIRNVHVVQTGCFQDQTLFMRKSKLAAHLAGCFIELRLDPDTGAVIEFSTTFRNYFVRGYYKNRWSQHGPVEHAPRSA